VATRRTKRLGALIQAELAGLLLRRVKDARLKGVSLTGVDVSPDLTQAKVYYSLLGGGDPERAQSGFQAAAAFLRRELAARLETKTIPRLIPVFDDSIAHGAHMDEVIRRVREEDRRRAGGQEEQDQ